jgi:hypothetical protein
MTDVAGSMPPSLKANDSIESVPPVITSGVNEEYWVVPVLIDAEEEDDPAKPQRENQSVSKLVSSSSRREADQNRRQYSSLDTGA